MKMLFKFITLIILSISIPVVEAIECNFGMQEELGRLAISEFSMCLTKYTLDQFNKGKKINYDVDACSKQAKIALTQYHGICDEGAAYASIPISSYSICKNLQIAARALGVTPAEGGDDRDICARQVMNEIEKSIYQQIKRKSASQ